MVKTSEKQSYLVYGNWKAEQENTPREQWPGPVQYAKSDPRPTQTHSEVCFIEVLGDSHANQVDTVNHLVPITWALKE